jgi:hypothetical protein
MRLRTNGYLLALVIAVALALTLGTALAEQPSKGGKVVAAAPQKQGRCGCSGGCGAKAVSTSAADEKTTDTATAAKGGCGCACGAKKAGMKAAACQGCSMKGTAACKGKDCPKMQGDKAALCKGCAKKGTAACDACKKKQGTKACACKDGKACACKTAKKDVTAKTAEKGVIAAKAAETKAVGKPQTLCPVMGGEIDKKLYVDHDGKRIYVCCEGCIATIKKNPAKYIKMLEDKGITLEKTPVTK